MGSLAGTGEFRVIGYVRAPYVQRGVHIAVRLHRLVCLRAGKLELYFRLEISDLGVKRMPLLDQFHSQI